MEKVLIILGFFAFMAVLVLLTAYPVMLLWNWLIPGLLGLHPLDFWQALGLLTLCQLLFTRTVSSDKKERR